MFMDKEKIKVFLDVDDTILKSSEAIIKILNEKYKIRPQKNIGHLRDWNYKSICRDVTLDDIEEIFKSDQFFDIVEIDNDFLEFYKNNQNMIDFVFLTKGTPENLKKKEDYLKSVLGSEIEYIGLPFKIVCEEDECNCKLDLKNYKKSSINMRHCIQIDDRVECLEDTNAPIKILYKKYSDHYQNRDYLNISNLYVVNSWQEIIQILEFAYNQHFIFKKCK